MFRLLLLLSTFNMSWIEKFFSMIYRRFITKIIKFAGRQFKNTVLKTDDRNNIIYVPHSNFQLKANNLLKCTKKVAIQMFKLIRFMTESISLIY